MAPFPLQLDTLLGKAGMYGVFLLIGFAFGYALEIGGFNHSPTLAAQFYFKDLRVLKVMFTAIIVAMILIFGASAIGLLDYNLIWVNPTYLWSGIVGGLIMGVGFIVGGFCPGTSLVAAATLKLDGIFFVLGGLVGVFTFGETVQYFEQFFNGSYYGRLTLMDVLHLPAGIVVVLVVLMALFMFWGGEKLEQIIGKKDLSKEPKARYAGAAVLLAAAFAVMLIGQPTPMEKWVRMADEKGALLEKREVQISPQELLHAMYDHGLIVDMVDLRSERDYNLFHIKEARRVPLEDITTLVPELRLAPANTVVVVMSNDETIATEAWKVLVAESVPNVYILEGGVNNWLATFAEDDARIRPLSDCADEQLCYAFDVALGHNFPASDPEFFKMEEELKFTPKIKLELKRGPSGGGCG